MKVGIGVQVFVGLCFAIAGCGASSEADSSLEDELRKEPTAQEIQALFKAVDENCAGNNNGTLGSFTPAQFSAASVAQEMRDANKSAMGVDCTDNQKLSSSRESAIQMFKEHTEDERDSTKSCLEQNLTPKQRSLLTRVVSDSKNLGVFATAYNGGDNSEACCYYTYRIYRANGALLEFTFNFTD